MEKYWKYWDGGIELVRKETDTHVESVHNYDFHVGIDIEEKSGCVPTCEQSTEITKAQYERLRKLAAYKLGLISK